MLRDEYEFSIVIFIVLMVISNLSQSPLPTVLSRPVIRDSDLELEKVVEGLESPTTLSFVDSNNFLVLESQNGTVRQVINDKLVGEPLIDLNVSNGYGRGLYGVDISRHHEKILVFLSFLSTGKGKDHNDFDDNVPPSGYLVQRYELKNKTLVSPLIISELPTRPGPFHYGGPLLIGPDKNLYHVVGDIGPTSPEMQTKNILDGLPPDRRGGILRTDQEGDPVSDWILGQEFPLNLYFAYGIRNSFGVAFDPITGYLWDTENGAGAGDEINLVRPGFNSGWSLVQGSGIDDFRYVPEGDALDPNLSLLLMNSSKRVYPLDFLESFEGRGRYSEPEFEWKFPVAPTSVEFLNTSNLGSEYAYDMMVGTFNDGSIYDFDLSDDRESLMLNGPLSDKIADNQTEGDARIIASGFAGITDLETGPDGFLYIVSYGDGTVYRIVPQ